MAKPKSKEYLRGHRAGCATTKRRALKKLRRWREYALQMNSPNDLARIAEYNDIIAELFR